MSGDETLRAVTDHLDALGADYELLPCDPQFADTAAFCERYGVLPEEGANAIVIKSKRGEPRYGLVMVLATCKVHNRAMRRLLQTSKASFASADETRELTGMMIGGVCPFGLPRPLPIWIDARVMGPETVIIGAGSRSAKIRVAPQVIAELPTAEIIDDLAVPIEPPDGEAFTKGILDARGNRSGPPF